MGKGGGGGGDRDSSLTVSTNVAVRARAPLEITVIVKSPKGVAAIVEIVRFIEHVGLHDSVEKVAVTPTGRP